MNSARTRFLAAIAAAILLDAATAGDVLAGGKRGFGSGLDVRVVTGDVRLSFSSGFHHARGGRSHGRSHMGPTRLLTLPRAAPRTFVVIPGYGRKGGYSKHYRYDHGYGYGYKSGYKSYHDKGHFQQYLGERSRKGDFDHGRRHDEFDDGRRHGGRHGGDGDRGGRGGQRRH